MPGLGSESMSRALLREIDGRRRQLSGRLRTVYHNWKQLKGQRDRWRRHIDPFPVFLADYTSKRNRFESMAELTSRECRKMLEDLKINGTVSCRVKTVASLKKKLEVNRAKFRQCGKHLHQHPDMGDLAGVRIGLNLPGDLDKVTEKISQWFDVQHRFAAIEPDAQNLGYKSWQVVVKLRKPKLRKAAKQLWKQRFRSLRVEIQVGMAVTQSLAEVQHDIIYKIPDDFRTTEATKQLGQVLYGLQISIQTNLEKLEDHCEEATREGTRRFHDGADLITWIQSTYLKDMGPEEQGKWLSVQTPEAADRLVSIWNRAAGRKKYLGLYRPGLKDCPDDFKDLIEERQCEIELTAPYGVVRDSQDLNEPTCFDIAEVLIDLIYRRYSLLHDYRRRNFGNFGRAVSV